MLKYRQKLRPLNVIGLNSGTSLDGVDAALFHIEPDGACFQTPAGKLPSLSITMTAGRVFEFAPAFRKRLKSLLAGGQTTLEEIARLNIALGEIFADAALSLIKGAASRAIDLIGSHGQTIWHAPHPASLWGISTRATLQLGEPAIICARTKIPVIADFRQNDMAYAGHGAPLVAFADEILFGKSGLASGILNLGGIANITIVDASGTAILAFDTGPGNMIVDRAMQTLFALDFDEGGRTAKSGEVQEKLLASVLAHPYFQNSPPKTTGRELFGQAFADDLISRGQAEGLSAADIVATATAITALSVSRAYKEFVLPKTKIAQLVLGGGGTENAFLVHMLSRYWPHEIKILRHEDFGISAKFKEALLFALLAYTTYFGIPNNVPACTGAKRKTCLGKLVLP